MSQANIYRMITEQIIDALKRGTVPWQKPWRGGPEGSPRNLRTGKPYRGVNVWLLAVSGYDSAYWLTYKQARERGGHVRRGEKSTPVVFWKWLDVENRDSETGETHRRRVPMLRYYRVFNVAQCEGIEPPDKPEEFNPLDFRPIETAEQIVRDMPDPPQIEHGRGQAAYVPRLDLVRMPERERFVSEPEYYSTLFHELVHATGHERRLARPAITEPGRFGDARYSREELLAEMGAAYLCGMAGIERETIKNSAAYLNNWINVLKGDAKLAVQAAAAAQKATDYVLDRQFDADAEAQQMENADA